MIHYIKGKPIQILWNIFKVVEKQNCQPTILCVEKISSVSERKIKVFSDEGNPGNSFPADLVLNAEGSFPG